MEYLNNLDLFNYIINMLKIEGGAHIYLSPSKTRKGVNSLLFFPVCTHTTRTEGSLAFSKWKFACTPVNFMGLECSTREPSTAKVFIH